MRIRATSRQRRGAPGRCRWRGFVLALALLGGAGAAVAQTSEAELKAAFVFNFARYVEWPADAGGAAGEAFRLCLLGRRDALFAALAALDGKSVGERSLRVRAAAREDDLASCHLLVVGESEAEHFERILQPLAGVPVLTVNGSGRFLDAGGIIGLVTENDRVRFDINLGAARRNGLALSSNLLKLARTVRQP